MEVSRPAEHASAYDSANPKIGASNQNTADLFTLAGGCDFSATLRRRQNAYQHFRKQAPPALIRRYYGVVSMSYVVVLACCLIGMVVWMVCSALYFSTAGEALISLLTLLAVVTLTVKKVIEHRQQAAGVPAA